MNWLVRLRAWRPPPPKDWSKLGALVFGVLTVLSTLGLFGAHHWTLDLSNHFRLYFALAALLCGAFTLLFSRRGLAALFFVLGLVNGAGVAPLYLDTGAQARDGAVPLTILHFNVNSQNHRRAEIIEFIREQDADLVFILEVGPEWGPLLSELAPQYEVIEYAPSFDNFGIAAVGRVPTHGSRVRRDNPLGLAALEVELEWDGAPLVVHGVHTYPPMGRRNAAARDTQLLNLAREVGADTRSTLVVGDFNATPWSSVIAGFEEASSLRNGQRGFGYQATWPTHLPLVRIPIDPSYHSQDLTVLDRVIGPDFGSDHRPVIFRVARVSAPTPAAP